MAGLLDFKLQKIREGSAEIFAPTAKVISKKLPVFYNPVMSLNRDITILLLEQFPKMRLCDPLAGTGIRSIRFAKELKPESITANDLSEKAVALIKKNMAHNSVKFEVQNKDANIMLMESTGFDFIDLDVFGSPNFVLDSAARRLSRKGVLAVTATDAAALCGSSPKACIRKYWAVPKKSSIMHETGLRILIRKVQLIGAQYDKALVPIFSHFKDHYFRVFFKCLKGKRQADEILSQHQCFEGAGPLWAGNLWDFNLAKKMLKSSESSALYSDAGKFIRTIAQEASINSAVFYDIHDICSNNGINPVPKKEDIILKIMQRGYSAASTHFKGTGIRTNIGIKDFLSLLKNK